MKKENKEQRINEILNSLDGMEKATAPNYFYNKLMGKMHAQQPSERRSLFLRPAFVVAALSIMLLVNVAMLASNPKTEKHDPQQEATVESFAEAYHLTTNSY